MRKSKGLMFISLITFLFLAIPLVMIVISAFGEASTIQFPIEGFTFKWFSRVFESRTFMSSLWTSFRLAIVASLCGLLLALPASYVLTQRKTKARQRLLSYFLSPNMIPGVVMGYALFQALVITWQIPLAFALLIGHILIVLPYSIRILAAGMETLDSSIEEAALSLGCRPIEAFAKVVLPNLMSPILASMLMSFINSFNNLPVSMYLKGPGVSTLPQTLMNHLEYNFDPSVSALSVLLMIVTFGLMVVIEKTMGFASLSN